MSRTPKPRFNLWLSVKAAAQAGVGGFLLASLAGWTQSQSLLLAAFMALGGALTDLDGYARQVKQWRSCNRSN